MEMKFTAELDVLAHYESLLQRKAELERQVAEKDKMLAAVEAASQKYVELQQRRMEEAAAKVSEIEASVNELAVSVSEKDAELARQVDDAMLSRRLVDVVFDSFCDVAGDALDALTIESKASLLQGTMAEAIELCTSKIDVSDWEQFIDFAIDIGWGKKSREWQTLSRAFSPVWRELPNSAREKIKEWQS
jgi:hypothetical protein